MANGGNFSVLAVVLFSPVLKSTTLQALMAKARHYFLSYYTNVGVDVTIKSEIL